MRRADLPTRVSKALGGEIVVQDAAGHRLHLDSRAMGHAVNASGRLDERTLAVPNGGMTQHLFDDRGHVVLSVGLAGEPPLRCVAGVEATSGHARRTFLRRRVTWRHARRTSRALVRLATILVGVAVSVGCGSAIVASSDTASTTVDPEGRAVRLETTACGFVSDHFGSGVVVADGLVLTVAHLVVRSESIDAYVDGRAPEQAMIAAVDLERDLAVLRVAATGVAAVQTTRVEGGTQGHIVGAASSGTVPFEVRRRVDLTIEEILGTERHSRAGYELAALTTDGDSGAGAYDEEQRLIGIVFAAGRDGETSWLTASDEIDDFLSGVGPDDSYEPCD